MARCVLRVFGIRLAAKGWCGAWWPWLCPLWARSGLQGCSIPCGAIRKWWPGEWPQASPAGPSHGKRSAQRPRREGRFNAWRVASCGYWGYA